MKCGKNHSFIQKPITKNKDENNICYICENNIYFPFYECKYCKD